MTEDRRLWVSDRFVQFVDIVFGVVIVQGFVRYDELILNPASSWFSFWALVGVYLTTTLSWIGYHRSMNRYPYETRSMKAWVRMFMDFIIVSVYAFLVFSVDDLQEGVKASTLERYLFGYFLMFIFYLASGFSRIWEKDDPQASQWRGLLIFALYYLLLVLLYPHMLIRQPISAETINWLFLFACPAPYVGYRVWRHGRYAPSS